MNVWTDMEKCIFLDRFLQFPKDFRRIASFLRNKTTKDCVAFYYDSKQTVPYKGALKEHMMRRKRKGDYQVWDASIQAVTSAGGTVSAGEDEEKPVIFGVPQSDLTFNTRLLHPLKREALDPMVIDEAAAAEYEGTNDSDDSRWKSRKRGRDPLFILDKEQTKFLRQASQELMTNTRPADEDAEDAKDGSKSADGETTAKKSAHKQKWTNAEKKSFVEALDKHGTPDVELFCYCLNLCCVCLNTHVFSFPFFQAKIGPCLHKLFHRNLYRRSRITSTTTRSSPRRKVQRPIRRPPELPRKKRKPERTRLPRESARAHL